MNDAGSPDPPADADPPTVGAVRSISSYFNDAASELVADFDFLAPTPSLRTDEGSERALGLVDLAALNKRTPSSDSPMDIIALETTCWIPTEATRAAILSSRAGAFAEETAPERTMPGILLAEPLEDPLLKLFREGRVSIEREKILSVHDVSQDASGLRLLVSTENFRSALQLTGRLLSAAGQGVDALGRPSVHTSQSLQLWTTRLALMFKSLLFSVAEAEMEAFGDFDRPDMYRDFSAPESESAEEGSEAGSQRFLSLVPFSLRLLWAELPAQVGRPDEALDRLYGIVAVLEEMMGNLEKGFGADGSDSNNNNNNLSSHNPLEIVSVFRARRLRTLHSIANVLVQAKDIHSAVKVYSAIAAAEIDAERRSAVLSGVGRLLLLHGDAGAAAEYFAESERVGADAAVRASDHKAFLDVGAGRFGEAIRHFRQTLSRRPDDPVAANNLAICLVYSGRLQEALASLKSLADDEATLHDGVVFNLSTLYDLESSNAAVKKKELLETVAAKKADSVSAHCLKVA